MIPNNMFQENQKQPQPQPQPQPQQPQPQPQHIIPFTSSKSQFIENVQRWTLIDSQLKIIHEKTKKLRNMKSDLSQQICFYMNENQLTDKKIGVKNGELRIVEKKEYSPLTFSYLEKTLEDIIPERENVQYIIQYLKDHREIKKTQEIRSSYASENE